MVKAKKVKSKRMTTRARVKVGKKVRAFRRQARRTARKMKQKGLVQKRAEKDPVLQIPNSWPGKEEILREAIKERELALEERKRKREEARKRREWERANPEKAALKRARAEAKALQLEEARRQQQMASQSFSLQLRKVLPVCNCILHILDARAPLASLSRTIEEAVVEAQSVAEPTPKEKLIVYVLNKVDLVPRIHLEKWMKALAPLLVDNPRLGIRRRVALYSSQIIDSSRVLLSLLQSVWLKGAQKHKIVACVVGQPNVGKHTIMRDLEVTSNVVSIHASSTVPSNPKARLHGSKEVALITLPRDSKRASAEPVGLDCIFKHNEAVLPEKVLKTVAEKMASCVDRKKLCTQINMGLFEGSGEELLKQLAQKRGLLRDKAPDLTAAGNVICHSIMEGKIAVATRIPETIPPLPGTNIEAPNEMLDHPYHREILKHLTVPMSKTAEMDDGDFATVDFDLSERPKEKKKKTTKGGDKGAEDGDDEELEEMEEMEEMSEGSDYKFNDEDFDSFDDEELEELEEMEEMEEGMEDDDDNEPDTPSPPPAKKRKAVKQ